MGEVIPRDDRGFKLSQINQPDHQGTRGTVCSTIRLGVLKMSVPPLLRWGIENSDQDLLRQEAETISSGGTKKKFASYRVCYFII